MTSATASIDRAGWIETGALGVAMPLRAVERWHRETDGDKELLTGRIRVDGDEPNLRGHFPGLAIFPGVFILESLCQLMAEAFGSLDAPPPVLRTLRSVRFLAPLLDGDELSLRVEVTTLDGGWSAKAVGSRSDGTVAARIRADFAPDGASDA